MLSPASRHCLRPLRQPDELQTPFTMPFDQHCQQSNAPTLSPTSSQSCLHPRLRPTEVPIPFATPVDQLCQHTNAPTPIRPRPDADKLTLLPASQCRLCRRLRPTKVSTPFATLFNQPSLRPAEAKPSQRPDAVRVCSADQLSSRRSPRTAPNGTAKYPRTRPFKHGRITSSSSIKRSNNN